MIGLSATLTPTEFHRTLLGLDGQRSAAVAIPSCFPPENQRVVIDTSVTTRWRDRSREAPRIARRIAEFSNQVPGHCLVLFPSYAFLAAVHDRLPPTAHAVTAQRAGSSHGEQQEVLERLRTGDPQLVLAVLGGIFAEGVDYPGEMLSQVIVVSPGLPQFNLERQLLKSYYDRHYGHG